MPKHSKPKKPKVKKGPTSKGLHPIFKKVFKPFGVR